MSTKRVRGSDVIPNQYLTAIYKDNDVFCEFEKNEDVNYAIPPPSPVSPTALIKKMNKENGFKDINNERGYYTTKNKNEIAYFYNNKAITKKELEEINPKDIKTVNIKKGKNGSSKIYIIGKE